jgi:NIMA (never in mitosis gene a)-related kinase
MSSKDFQILSKLGEGSYSSVWKVKRLSDGQEYAMKKVKLSALNEKERENALNEVRILASIKSPYIIGYKEAFFEDNSMTLCIVMEYAAGGDLYNKIVQHTKNKTYFKEEEIWSCLINMALALKTLHEMKILHRDLKCANVFISKDGKECKLGDLNVSKIAKNNLAHTQTGTPYYASPEVWRD